VTDGRTDAHRDVAYSAQAYSVARQNFFLSDLSRRQVALEVYLQYLVSIFPDTYLPIAVGLCVAITFVQRAAAVAVQPEWYRRGMIDKW